MARVVRSVDQVVAVERRQFAVSDAAEPPRLPDRISGENIAVGDGCATVTSTVGMHDAEVRLELWDEQPPAVEQAQLAEVELEFRSGSVAAWSIPHGPVEPILELDGPGRYALRVYRHGGGPAVRERQDASDPPVFSGLESYEIRLWRRPPAE
ncbi:hypothetical protein [Streptomyces boninensis]|uniref:hypothetical protein n=1 Tax=Streptomyces boninensis TaxID=2039455 RepID=UPI003B2191CE